MTIIPRKTACLNCILEEEKIKQSKGSLAPCVSLIASIQSVETIKTILNIGKKLENKLLSVDSLSMEFKTLSLKRNPNCKTCSS
jgi:adenylyltransferase/sulfurtransferase